MTINALPAKLTIRELHRYFWSINRSMTVLFWAMVIMSILGLIGYFVDPRMVTGLPVWAKTTKFALSMMLYSATMLWVFGFDTLRPRLSRFILTAGAWILEFEMVLILIQGTRGVPMHFNFATDLDAALFGIMGLSIALFWFINALGIGVLIAQQVPSRVLAWSLRLGLVIALIGMGQGWLMTAATAEQEVLLQAGQQVDAIGGHTVGAPDGGPGLTLLGWSTTHGDLRIGHFVGLHGLQFVPLLGVFLMLRREAWLTESRKLMLLVTGAVGYLGLVGVTTWQALRGQSFFAPDMLSTGAYFSVIGGAILVAAAILFHARSTSKPTQLAQVS